MLDNDPIAAALRSVKILSGKKFQHFYDQHQNVGKMIAKIVGWVGKTAWDIYLFYEPYADWTEIAPKPKYWMHQLSDEWAQNDKYRTGRDLTN
jgi:hypothetical protein